MDIQSIFKAITFDTFAKCYWGDHVFRGDKQDFISELLSWDIVSQFLQDQHNQFIYNKNTILLRSNSFHDAEYPSSFADIVNGLERGLTLQIRRLQDFLSRELSVIQLARTFEQVLLHPLDSITFFYSLPGSQPTAIHKDIGEIFSFQIAGKKKWIIAKQKCFSEKMWYQEGELTDWNSYVLEPGDFIYLPSYFPHQVQCVEEASISTAFVFRNIQFESIFSYLKEDPVVKSWITKPLPILGDQSQYQLAQNKIEEFLVAISARFLQFDKKQYVDGMSQQLFEFIRQNLK